MPSARSPRSPRQPLNGLLGSPFVTRSPLFDRPSISSPPRAMTSSHPTPPPKPGQGRSVGRLATWQRALRATFSLTLVLKNLRWLGEPFIWMPALVISLATLGAWKFWKSPDAGDVGNRDSNRVDWLSLLESQPDADSVAADIDSSNVLATELVAPAAKPGGKNAKNQGKGNQDNAPAAASTSEQALSDIMKLLNLTGSSPAGGRSRSDGAPANAAQGSDRPSLPDTQFSQFSQFLNNSSSGDRFGGTNTTSGTLQPVSPLQAALDRLYLNGTEGNPSGNPTADGASAPTATSPVTTTAPATYNPTQPAGGSGYAGGYNPGAVPGYGAGYGLPGGALPGAGAGINPAGNAGINPGGTMPKIPTAGLYSQPGGSSMPLNAGYNTVPNTSPAVPTQPAPAAAPEPATTEPSSNITGRQIRTFSNPW